MSQIFHSFKKHLSKWLGHSAKINSVSTHPYPLPLGRETEIPLPKGGGRGGIEMNTIPIAPVNSNLMVVKSPIQIELLCVPAGEFLMGSNPTKDKYAVNDEQPQHLVYLSEYYIGKTPVTNVQYAAFAKATNLSFEIPKDKDQHPVVMVSWNDAVAFCEWLSDETQQTFSLPSEAQWEKAARGIDGRIYPWGNDFDKNKCNTQDGGVGDTTPVGKYSPVGDSPYGCVDMSGNVGEWCLNGWDAQAYIKRISDMQNLENENIKVVRGGSWIFYGGAARLAMRDYARVDNSNSAYGFRIVCSAPPIGLTH